MEEDQTSGLPNAIKISITNASNVGKVYLYLSFLGAFVFPVNFL